MEILSSLLAALISPIIDFFEKKFKKVPPLEILKRREEIKTEIERNLQKKDEYGTHGEVIIRNINSIDSYPEIDGGSKSISPWFKVEIKGLYHRGLEVFISMPINVVFDEKSKRWNPAKKENDSGKVASPVGRISFDNIIKIDWKGDEHYSCPHIYCSYKGKKREPYEQILFYEHKK